MFASPYSNAPIRKAKGGLLGSGDGTEIVANILGKAIEDVTEEDIDLVVDLIAQQTVLSAPEMQYDNVNSNVAGFNSGSMVDALSARDMYAEDNELLKLLGE